MCGDVVCVGNIGFRSEIWDGGGKYQVSFVDSVLFRLPTRGPLYRGPSININNSLALRAGLFHSRGFRQLALAKFL